MPQTLRRGIAASAADIPHRLQYLLLPTTHDFAAAADLPHPGWHPLQSPSRAPVTAVSFRRTAAG